MLHLWMIIVFAAVLSYDSASELAASHETPMPQPVSGVAGIGFALAPMAALALVVHVVLWACARNAGRGSQRALVTAERTLTLSRWLALLLHIGAVYGLGLLAQIRAVIGNLVIVDELLALLPAVLVVAFGWWSLYPIEVLVRGATTLRRIDEGRPVHLWPTRWQALMLHVRHQLLISLVPIALLSAWTEFGDLAVRWAARAELVHSGTPAIGRWLGHEQSAALARGGLQVFGLVMVLGLSPLILSVIWDTVRLGPGLLRDRLMQMCEHSGVRIRELLVWRTHGTMINGAVIGILGRFRYILLTDALLHSLPQRQVEAVMAHEVAHARHSHLPWLIITLAVGIIGGGFVVSLLALGAAIGAESFVGHDLVARTQDSLGIQGLLMVGSLVAGVVGFGFVSRRFEWQADAFAVKQLSVLEPRPTEVLPVAAVELTPLLFDQPMPETRGNTPPEVHSLVTREAVVAMTLALDAVAELNHMPRNQRSFRHGSIAHRQGRLQRLVGAPLDSLKIDRSVRRLKWLLAIAGVFLLALAVLPELLALVTSNNQGGWIP